MRHVQLRCRAASWSWQSSTERLKQNLAFINTELPRLVPRTDQWLWDRHSAVLQTDARNMWTSTSVMPGRTARCTQWNSFGAYDPFGGSSASHDEGTCVEDGRRQMLREFYGSAFASGVDGWFMFKNEDANRLALTIVARSRNRCEAPLLRRMFHKSFSEPRSMYCAREAVHFACNSFISMVRCVVGGT